MIHLHFISKVRGKFYQGMNPLKTIFYVYLGDHIRQGDLNYSDSLVLIKKYVPF